MLLGISPGPGQTVSQTANTPRRRTNDHTPNPSAGPQTPPEEPGQMTPVRCACMKQRADSEPPSSGDRRGSYSRGGSTKKRCAHAKYAWDHRALVHSLQIGRPCDHTCPFKGNCMLGILPGTFIKCHEFSYGTDTTMQEAEEEGSPSVYRCNYTLRQTMAAWRTVALNSITTSTNGVRVERFMVDTTGPVCARVCQTAYGIHDSTWADMLASARNGTLSAESLVQEEHGLLALLDADEESFSNSKEVTIDWWKLWLTLEDQMPNEPVIQHRILMWMDVWKVEYCSDMAWWIAGGVKPLSLPRWVNLRKEALTELACEWYGTGPRTRHSGYTRR